MNRIQKALEKVPDVFTSYEGRLLCQPIRQCAVTNVLLPKSFLIRLVIAQSQYGVCDSSYESCCQHKSNSFSL